MATTTTTTTTTATTWAYSSDGRTDGARDRESMDHDAEASLALQFALKAHAEPLRPRPSPDRPTQTAVHDTHEQHHSSASARPTKAAGLGRGSGDSGDSGDSGRGTRSRLAGQGQRHRQAAARQKPNETRAIGGRERARLACESGPGGEQVEKSNSKPSGADRKWSQRIALTAPRSRGRRDNWEIIKKIQFCQCWASERGCIANRPRAQARQQLAVLPHIADLSVAAGVELHSRSRHSRESNKDERHMVSMHGGSQH
jgi:hypothetical protein